MGKDKRNRRSKQPPMTNTQQVAEVTEPKSYFDIIMTERHLILQAFFEHERQRGNRIARLTGSIMENGLECKKEPHWLGVKCPGDKLLMSSPDGRLFLFDCRSREVYWSIPTGKALHVSYQSSENNCSYIVFRGVGRAYKCTKDSELMDLKCYASELVAEPDKYLDGDIVPSKSITILHVNLGTGQRIFSLTTYGDQKFKEATTDSFSDDILCITRFDYQLTCFKPGTDIVLWYKRIAGFDISIVSRNEVTARMGKAFIKSPTVGKISFSDRVIGKRGKDTLLVEGEYQHPAVILCIEKGQSDDDVAKKEISSVSDVCNANHNFVNVYGVESDQDFNYVAIEYCGTTLREFIRSFHNPRSQHLKDYSKLLKLIREIITTLAWLHCNGKSHGNLNLDSIFVDKNSGPKILVFSLSKDATDDMLALGHIIFFCFIGVEYNNENLYSPKPQNHLKPIYDCPDALDLLNKLLDKNPETRATALQASNHTLFWSPRKNLRFIRAVTERLELKGPKLLKAINSIDKAVFGQRWNTYLPTDFLDVMKDGSYRNHVYHYNSMYDLLCIIRNLKTHETRIRHQLSLKKGLHPEVQQMFGTAGFESYFRRKFPNLVNEVYNVMKKHIGEEASFLEFYKKSPS